MTNCDTLKKTQITVLYRVLFILQNKQTFSIYFSHCFKWKIMYNTVDLNILTSSTEMCIFYRNPSPFYPLSLSLSLCFEVNLFSNYKNYKNINNNTSNNNSSNNNNHETIVVIINYKTVNCLLLHGGWGEGFAQNVISIFCFNSNWVVSTRHS